MKIEENYVEIFQNNSAVKILSGTSVKFRRNDGVLLASSNSFLHKK